jgi:amino acid transporter
MSSSFGSAQGPPRLRRALGLWDLILYGIVLIQPTAPVPVYGVMSVRAHGHVVTVVLLAGIAMLFTAASYGRMARAYPSAGSAFTYVGRELHPFLGYVTGWCMCMDYLLIPLVCTILCSKFVINLYPGLPYHFWALVFILLFTLLNLLGVRTAARINILLMIGMSVVIVIFLAISVHYVMRMPHAGIGFFTHPFFDPHTFSARDVLGGTSLAVLTYIGFDGISTLSEEVINPRRNILLATVLTCLITGVLSAVQVYAAQLIWPAGQPFPDVDTAFVYVARQAGGYWLFSLINAAMLVSTFGSGINAQLGAARLLYGMGRGNAIPRKFFGAIHPKSRIPRNNVLFIAVFVLAGTLFLNFEMTVQLLNFGALLAFMGVNCAAFFHYFVRRHERTMFNVLVPGMGFLVCLLLWWGLNWRAKLLGSLWLAIGIAYGAWNTKFFRRDLVNFDVPTEQTGEPDPEIG